MPDSLRKAAILICSLDDPSADALLEQMPDAQAARVRNAVMDLDDIDPLEQERVIAEFLRCGAPAASTETAGVELQLDSTPATSPVVSQPAAPAPRSVPFGFLQQARGDTLTQFLQREHPQTMAVVIAHLPAERAADVLSRLPAPLQTEVLQRIAELQETDPDILRELEQQLQLLLADQLRGDRHHSPGVAAVHAILGAADQPDRRRMLANLQQRNQQLASQFAAAHGSHEPELADHPAATQPPPTQPPPTQPPPTQPPPTQPAVIPPEQEPAVLPLAAASDRAATAAAAPSEPTAGLEFHDLAQLDNHALAATFRAADPETVLLALLGARRPLVDRILGQLPTRDSKSLRRKMEQLGPLRLSDVEQAQQELARLAGQLVARAAAA